MRVRVRATHLHQSSVQFQLAVPRQLLLLLMVMYQLPRLLIETQAQKGNDARLLLMMVTMTETSWQLSEQKGKSTDMSALQMDAQIKSSVEGYATGMVQGGNSVATWDVQILQSKEECALSMGQR